MSRLGPARTQGASAEYCRPVNRWYETADWNAPARADFEDRLRRSRARPEGRAEFLRRKAVALEEAGQLDQAVGLYERFVADEHARPAHLVATVETLGNVARRRGRLDEAEQRYRQVLTFRPRRPISGMVEVSLAEVLLDLGRPGEAAIALDEVEMDPVTAFHANLFRYLAARARVARAQGDDDAAAESARRALSLIDTPDQYSRHSGVGVARPDDEMVSMLRDMIPAVG
jgi:predicted Zn-dependent protease